MRHYIVMAGLHGCLPATCDVCETAKQAAESLAFTHELSRSKTRRLQRDYYLELNLEKDGNEYAEITECDCTDPSTHMDG